MAQDPTQICLPRCMPIIAAGGNAVQLLWFELRPRVTIMPAVSFVQKQVAAAHRICHNKMLHLQHEMFTRLLFASQSMQNTRSIAASVSFVAGICEAEGLRCELVNSFAHLMSSRKYSWGNVCPCFTHCIATDRKAVVSGPLLLRLLLLSLGADSASAPWVWLATT